jgi:anti-sigma regulatory factor (Ser/Thr protein kinase)
MGQAYPDQMATLLVVAYEPATGQLQAASAGHLPPMLVAPDGTTRFVPVVPGPPICVGDETAPDVATVTVPAGTRLVLFTDGLVERRGEGIDEGLSRLSRVAQLPSSPSEDLAHHLVDALVPPGGPADDVAFLVAHLGVAGPMLDLWVEADTAQLSVARRAVKAWLGAAGHPDADDLLLAANEAIANALEHAYTDGERRPVRVQGRLDDGFRFEVTDRGQWRNARDGDDGRGRGISIMRALMDDVAIETTDAGTTVVLRRAGTRARPPAGGLVTGR